MIAPTGTVADGYGAITYTWEPVENATGYQLYVAPADGGPGLPIHVQVGAEVCDASICTLDPSSIDPKPIQERRPLASGRPKLRVTAQTNMPQMKKVVNTSASRTPWAVRSV